MNQGNDRQAAVILSLIGIIPVVWLGLLIAPSVKGGLPEILTSLMNAMNAPFHIELCEDSVKAVLVLLFCYGMGVGIYFSTRRNYRRREEHGSAKWGSASAVNKKYAQQPKSENKLLTQNVAIGLNAKKHRRNLNTLVIGGSGAGKTRFFCKPNLMQCCRNSYFVLDPKGEIVRDVGELLSQKGYEVRVLDLISMEKSHCYNPFVYLQSDNDIQRLVTNLFKATTPKGSQSKDPFWDTSASMLLSALVYYLHYEAPEDEQNFAMVMEIYEDQVLGNISAERYARMSVNYENEQRELVKRVDEDEKRLVSIEQTSLDLKILLKVLRSSTAFEELTPTLVNSLIRRIEVHNNDKSSGHCSVKVDIYFTAIGLIDIPTKDEIKILMEKIQSNPQEYRLTA